MKVNINKLLSGGSTSPFMPGVFYQGRGYISPDQLAGATEKAPTQAAAKSDKDDDKDFKLLSQEVINELIKNGLPNEVEDFLGDLYAYENSNSGLFSEKTSKNKYYQLANKASKIIHNRDAYDKALKLAEENGSLSEYAVSGNGGMYVRDAETGEFKVIGFDTYQKKSDKYIPMSYQDVIETRAYDPNAVFNKGIKLFSDIRQSVGMDKISENILGIISKLGTGEVSKEDYITAGLALDILMKQMSEAEQQQMAGLAQAYAELGPNALFKLTQSESGYQDYEAAFKYIYSVLPENQKRQLTANYLIEGGEDKDPNNIILNALKMTEKTKQSMKLDFDKTTSNGGAGASKSGKSYNMNMMEQFFNGDLNQTEVNFTDPSFNNKYQISLKGNTIPTLITDNNKGTGTAPLLTALEAKGLGMSKYLDYNTVYFGNNKINSADMQEMLYHEGLVAKVWVPTDGNGNVDFESLSRYSVVQERLKESGVLDKPDGLEKQTEINNAFAQAGLPIKVDEAGNYTSNSNMEEFLLTYAYSKQNNLQKNNFYMKTLNSHDEDAIDELMSETFNRFKMDDPVSLWRSMAVDTVVAPVLIRVKPNSALNAQNFANHGSLMNPGTISDNLFRQELMEGPEPGQEIIGNSALMYQE